MCSRCFVARWPLSSKALFSSSLYCGSNRMWVIGFIYNDSNY